MDENTTVEGGVEEVMEEGVAMPEEVTETTEEVGEDAADAETAE